MVNRAEERIDWGNKWKRKCKGTMMELYGAKCHPTTDLLNTLSHCEAIVLPQTFFFLILLFPIQKAVSLLL